MRSCGQISRVLLILAVSLAGGYPQETQADDCLPSADGGNVSFNASSYAALTWQPDLSQTFQMDLNFRTRPVREGTLFEMVAGKAAFFMRIHGVLPCFELEISTGFPEMDSSFEWCPERPLDGLYDVVVKANDSVLEVELNGVVNWTIVNMVGVSCVDFRFGQLQSNGQHQEHGFTGCLTDVILNGTPVNLREEASKQKHLRPCTREEMCHSQYIEVISVAPLHRGSTPSPTPSLPVFQHGASITLIKETCIVHPSLPGSLSRQFPLYSSTFGTMIPYRTAMTKDISTTGLDTHSPVVSMSSLRIPDQSATSSASPVAMIPSRSVVIPVPSPTVKSLRSSSVLTTVVSSGSTSTSSTRNVASSLISKSKSTVTDPTSTVLTSSFGLIAGYSNISFVSQSYPQGLTTASTILLSSGLVTSYSNISFVGHSYAQSLTTTLTSSWTSSENSSLSEQHSSTQSSVLLTADISPTSPRLVLRPTSHLFSTSSHSGSREMSHLHAIQRNSVLDLSQESAGYTMRGSENSTGTMHGMSTPTEVATMSPTLAAVTSLPEVDVHGELMKLNHMNITIDMALNVTMELERLTSDPRLLHASDIAMTVGLLERVTNTQPNDTKVGDYLLGCVSNLMDVENVILSQSQTSWNSAVRVVKMIDYYASTVPVKNSKSVEIRSGSVHLIVAIPGEELPSDGIEFPDSFANSSNELSTKSSVQLSGHTLASQNGDGDHRWWFVSYKNSKLFQSSGNGMQITSEVVALSVDSGPLKNLSHPVVLKFRNKMANGSCVFWKFADDGTGGQWANEGCWKRHNTTVPYTICECNHLTHFAITLEPLEPATKTIITNATQDEELSDETKNIVIAGCGVAVLTLTLTLITFLCMRKKRFGVYGNLCFCVIICNVLFVVSLFPSGTDAVCQGIGVALHLFMMLSFAWLVGKSLSLLWTVFFDVDNNGWFNRHGGKVMVLLCWGIPIVYVGLLGYFNFSDYGSKSLCWLHDDYIWWIAGPITGATGLSLLVWFVTICQYCCRSEGWPQTSENRNKQLPSLLLGMFLIGCGLGTTWLLATFWLLWYRDDLFLSYILAGDNFVTSLLMFVFYCLADSQIRSEYARVFGCHAKETVHMSDTPHDAVYMSSSAQTTMEVDQGSAPVPTLDALQHEFITHWDLTQGAAIVQNMSYQDASPIMISTLRSIPEEQARSLTPDTITILTGQGSTLSFQLDSGIHEHQVFEVPMPDSPGILKQVLSTEGLREDSGSEDSMIMESRL